MKKINILIAISLFTLLGTSCEKYVDTPLPKNEIVSKLTFTSDLSATAAVTGVYSNMNAFNYQFSNILMSYLGAMQADDMYYYTSTESFDVFRFNRLLPNSQYVNRYWADLYSYIAHSNACIEGLIAAEGLTPSVKDQLLGEAYFQRAFFYFYLVNLYGKVPLITSTTDYQANNVRGRDEVVDVYNNIINDLTEAKTLMAANYPTGTRLRPNRAAASALLARVYLYLHQWALAETEATAVLTDNQYSLLADLNSVFLANSREAIWQLESVNYGGGRNTWEGFASIPGTPTGGALFRLDTVTLIPSFEPNDLRLIDWIGKRVSATTGARHFFPYKYHVRFDLGGPITEHSMVMRFAEQFLIRAEARIQQDKLAGGASDIDSIRLRADLTPFDNRTDKAALLLEVEKQRRLELFAEWGHRWFDLKRTNRADAVLKLIPGKDWQVSDTLYPVPQDARSTNINLDQNTGYPLE